MNETEFKEFLCQWREDFFNDEDNSNSFMRRYLEDSYNDVAFTEEQLARIAGLIDGLELEDVVLTLGQTRLTIQSFANLLQITDLIKEIQVSYLLDEDIKNHIKQFKHIVLTEFFQINQKPYITSINGEDYTVNTSWELKSSSNSQNNPDNKQLCRTLDKTVNQLNHIIENNERMAENARQNHLERRQIEGIENDIEDYKPWKQGFKIIYKLANITAQKTDKDYIIIEKMVLLFADFVTLKFNQLANGSPIPVGCEVDQELNEFKDILKNLIENAVSARYEMVKRVFDPTHLVLSHNNQMMGLSVNFDSNNILKLLSKLSNLLNISDTELRGKTIIAIKATHNFLSSIKKLILKSQKNTNDNFHNYHNLNNHFGDIYTHALEMAKSFQDLGIDSTTFDLPEDNENLQSQIPLATTSSQNANYDEFSCLRRCVTQLFELRNNLVGSGDDWESLVKRFYQSGESANDITDRDAVHTNPASLANTGFFSPRLYKKTSTEHHPSLTSGGSE